MQSIRLDRLDKSSKQRLERVLNAYARAAEAEVAAIEASGLAAIDARHTELGDAHEAFLDELCAAEERLGDALDAVHGDWESGPPIAGDVLPDLAAAAEELLERRREDREMLARCKAALAWTVQARKPLERATRRRLKARGRLIDLVAELADVQHVNPSRPTNVLHVTVAAGLPAPHNSEVVAINRQTGELEA
ncbi:MAG: hypothetical protein H6747_09030 [Deltaproteobacteria bacterium]|nr:hypothetical protein [Deltaproteobacteria bacterium]